MLLSNEATIVNLKDMICSSGSCDAIQDGNFIFRDNYHLAREGSAYLGVAWDWAELVK